MKLSTRPFAFLLAGTLLGFAASRIGTPGIAIAQTTAPAATTAPMPMMSGGAMTRDSMMGCPGSNGMMQGMHGPADQVMMHSIMQMHHNMSKMHFSGSADHDFMTMMVRHHEAAIAMANAEITYGKDRRVIGLAKSIIAAQQKEIDEMQSWLKP